MQPLNILYQDEHLVAVHKPSGLLVHRSALARGETEFLLQRLRDQLGKLVQRKRHDAKNNTSCVELRPPFPDEDPACRSSTLVPA